MLERLIRLIGEEKTKEIQNLNIFLIGIGGVGGYALESLIRSGIRKMTICDGDTIEESNLNRQIISNVKNIGQEKSEEAKKRAELINPKCQITIKKTKLKGEDISNLNLEEYDYVIDACDDVSMKVALIEYCMKQNIKIISCMGTGNRMHPEKLQITKLSKTENDPLAKKMRNLLRKRDDTYLKVPVVFSKELPIKTQKLGTFCSVPMAAGSLLASYVINDKLNY